MQAGDIFSVLTSHFLFLVQKQWKLQALIELKQKMLRHVVSVQDYIKAHDVLYHTSTSYSYLI